MIILALPLAAFLSAACSLSLEIAIVRLGAPFVGQSLLPWSAAIASVLIGLTAGHILGGLAGGTDAGPRRLRLWLARAWLAAGGATLAMLMLVEPVAVATATASGFGAGAAIAIAALACPPSFAAGFIAPLLVRITTITPGLPVARLIGLIYAASATGSVIGTAAAGFFLLESIGATGLIYLVAAIWFLLGLFALRHGSSRAMITFAGLGAALAASIIFFAPNLSPCQIESRYTCIQLFDKPLESDNLLRLMVLDEGVHSASDRNHPERLHLGYAALTDRLAQAALASSTQPRALVIGGGGATLPRAWASANPPADVIVAELDAEVARLARDLMWASPSDRLSTIIGDGRAVLRGLPPDKIFDVVLMDAYRSRSVPPHLVSAEFDAQVAARLASHGVFLSNIIDHSGTPLLALSVARTLATIFPVVDLWLADEPDGLSTNVVVAAWKNPANALRPSHINVAATVMDDGEATKPQSVTWRRIGFENARGRWPQACMALLTDDWTPVDRLLAGRNVCATARATQ